MRKIISKIAGTLLGLSLALGVGIALRNRSAEEQVHATTTSMTSFDSVSGYVGGDSNVSYLAEKGGASTAPAVNSNQIRIYQNGGLLTITANNSVTLTSITIGSAMATSVQVNIDSAGFGSDNAISANSTYSTGTISASTNVVFKCTGTDKNSRLYLNSLSVSYDAGSGTVTTQYDVTFDYQGHGTNSTSKVNEGLTVSKPNDPTAEGYTFGGWFKEPACTTAWDFANDTITSDTTIYAKWTEEEMDGNTLSFDLTSNPGGWPTANETTLTDYTYTLNGVDYTFKLKNVKQNSGYLMLTQPAAFGLPSISGKKLTKVVISNSGGCSTSVKVGISSSGTSESYISGGAIQTFATTGSSYTYNLVDTEEDTVYFVYVTNKNAQFTNIALTYEDAESSGTKIQLYAADIEMNYGDSPVAIVVKNADNLSEVISDCTFESSDSTIASIENGTVVAAGKGVATITVTHADDTSDPTSTIVYKSTTFTVTVIKPDTIADLYTYAKNTAVEFDGYYAGEYADGIVLMDGSRGILVYKGASESDWVVDETIVHVTGTTTEYGGLVEIASGATISTLSGSDYTAAAAKLALPSNHHLVAADASSTDKTLGNRRTYVSGVLKSIENASTANCYDVVVTVDSVDLSLYLKAADNVEITLSDSSTSTISNYLSNNVNKNVTIRGFTSFYSSSFQVRVYGILEASETYLVEDFAQEVLDETDKVCSVYSDDNKSRLTKTWGDLEEKWNTLSETEKGKWQDTSAYTPNYDNDSESVVENALGRYNLLCKKYFSTNNFTNRSDVNGAPVQPQGAQIAQPINASNSSTIVIVVVALTSITSIGVLLVIKRKRSLVK